MTPHLPIHGRIRLVAAALLASALLAAFAVGLPTAHAADPPARPNILWISLEDISPDLGCYGDAYAVTPNIDRLASQGVRFTRAFSHAGVCAPTRSGVITGMYPTTIGTHHMRCKGVPPEYVKCFTEYLRAAGYFCTNDSKTDYNFDAPDTAWDENRPGAHWRHRPKTTQPFFSVINLTTTHESQIRLPDDQLAKRRESLEPHERHDPVRAVLPPYYPDTPVTRLDWARYYDNLSFTDRQVGRILRDLEADGLADSTVVFFWGDHGRGLPRAKRWVYDSGTRIPLIVRWPGQIEAGSVREDLVCVLDFAPTLLSIAGVASPTHWQGQAFLGPARATPRKYVFAARDRMDEAYDIIRSVRDERFRYIRNYRPEVPYAQRIAYMDEMPTMREWRRMHAAGQLVGPQTIFFSAAKPIEELYDTAADPHEVRNLADDPKYAGELARLREVHERWMRDTQDLGLIAESELNERVRPNGQWSVAEAPEIQIADGRITLRCATPGASVAWQIVARDAPANGADVDDKSNAPGRSGESQPMKKGKRAKAAGNESSKESGKADGRKGAARVGANTADDRGAGASRAAPWQLYSEPIPLADVQRGAILRVKACRLGYRDSEFVARTLP